MHFLLTGGNQNPLKPTYANALAKYKHTSEVLYPTQYLGDILQYDALLLTGGCDIHPKYFNKTLLTNNSESLDAERDKFEFKLLEQFLKQQKTIIGICRGLQVINIYFGGDIWQDLPSQLGISHKRNRQEDDILTHNIVWIDGSVELVNSDHHQAINKLAEGFQVCATSQKNHIIEAVKHKILPIRAVQWHPELDTEKYFFEFLLKDI